MHNLFHERCVEAQGGNRPRAWHLLGPTFTEPLTATEVFKLGRLDYKIGKFPALVDLSRRDAAGALIGAAVAERVPDLFHLVRQRTADDPHLRVLGQCGGNYAFLQNMEVAEMVDALCKANRWHVETAGALGQGETVFVALQTGKFEVAGDAIERYLVLKESRNGGASTNISATCVRPVCQNTIEAGEAAASNMVRLAHGADLKETCQQVLAMMARLIEIQQESEKALQLLPTIPVTLDTARDIIAKVYPAATKPGLVKLADAVDGDPSAEGEKIKKARRAWESKNDDIRQIRVTTEALFHKFNDEFPAAANTGWPLYNVIAEMEDHFRPSRNDVTRAESILGGDRRQIKIRAYDLIAALK